MSKKKTTTRKTTKKSTTPRTAKSAADKAVQPRDVWYAGIGALSLASDRGERLWQRVADTRANATEVLSGLVNRGQKVRMEAIDDVREQVETRSRTFGRSFREMVEDGVERTLSMLNIPTRDEMERLSDQVDKLTAKVESMAPKRRTARKKNIAA